MFRRVAAMWRARRAQADLAEEIETHRQLIEQRLRQSGLSAADAGSASRRAMGNVTLAREDARWISRSRWVESVWQDLTYAARSLRRQPGFTLIAGGTLALAIGLNTSLLTTYNALAWRPWPVPDVERVVNIGRGRGAGAFSLAAYRYLSERTTAFEGIFAERRAGNTLLGEESWRASWVSGSYFPTLAVPMTIGRGLTPDDDRSGAAAAAVIAHHLWRGRFHSNPAIVGQTVTIDDVPVAIVGVAPREFVGTVADRVDLWLTLSSAIIFRPNERWVRDELVGGGAAANRRLSGSLAVSGRLAPGITAAQAQAEIDLLAGQFEPAGGTQPRVVLYDTTGSRGVSATPFVRMLGAVLTVLLLACANVGNLLLARAGARRREIAVRLSLGASRARLVRQLLTESLVLALIAGAGGTLIAVYLPRFVIEWMVGRATALQLTPDLLVMSCTVGLCGVACLLFGLAPALHATRARTARALKDSESSTGFRFSLRTLLLSAQVALSVVLLVSAALLIRGLQEAHALDHGFRIQGVTVTSFVAPGSAYDPARTRVFSRQLIDRLDAVARDAPIALAHVEPFGSGNIKGGFRIPGGNEDEFNAVYEVSPSYFDVLGLPLVAGRVFGPADRNGIVVNETLARRLGAVPAAIGRTLAPARDPGWNLAGELQIVGVVRDANRTVLEEIHPTIYQPISGRTIPLVIARDAPDASARVAAIAAAIDPRVRVRVAPLSESIGRRLERSRAAAAIATSLGALALSLAGVGMFSVFAFWVQQRRKEIGIRVALGARESQVIQLVLGSSGRSIVLGLAVGFAAAMAAARLLRSSLYGVSTIDPVAYAGVAAALAAVSVLATLVPARRATRIDPVVTLRYE